MTRSGTTSSSVTISDLTCSSCAWSAGVARIGEHQLEVGVDALLVLHDSDCLDLLDHVLAGVARDDQSHREAVVVGQGRAVDVRGEDGVTSSEPVRAPGQAVPGNAVKVDGLRPGVCAGLRQDI